MQELKFKTIDGNTAAGAAESRNRVVKINDRSPRGEKGIKFARFAKAMMLGGEPVRAHEVAKQLYGASSPEALLTKQAVSAGSTLDPDWAGPLAETYRQYTADFVDYLRSNTILGAFGRNGIPPLRAADFNIKIPTQVTGGDAAWVPQGGAIPLTRFNFDSIELGWAKIGTIAVVTKELARWSHPSAELIIRDQLAAAVIARMDQDFVDPGKAAVPNISPASILHNVPAIASVGGADIEAVKQDVEAAYLSFFENDNPPDSACWILSSRVALRLSLMQNMLGNREFPEMSAKGGILLGVPCIVSNYLPTDRAILVNASDIYYVHEGVNIDSSDSVSLEMDSVPSSSSTTPTGANNVSMFQTDSIATKVVTYANWAKRRPGAACWISGIRWGAHGAS